MGRPGRKLARDLYGVLALGAAVASTPSGRARASAFNEPAGHGVVILSATVDGGDRSFSADGNRFVPTTRYRKRDLSAYIEYGVTDWLQLVLKPDLVAVGLGGPSPARYTGFGTSEAGAQVRLLVFGPAVLAAQGSVQLPASTRDRNRALVGNTSRNADGRLLLGVAFPIGRWPSFLDAEAGYRPRDSGAPDEVHVDLTLGTRPRPDLLLLLQNFTTVPKARGTAWFPASQYSNLKASVVYDVTLHWSLQLGVYETIEGRDALRERGVSTAVWYRF